MRKRNTPIRMITVRPAQPRSSVVMALARRFGMVTGKRRASQGMTASMSRELPSDGLDLDQRVRAVGEW